MYPHNFEDHIKNMSHLSENGNLIFPNETIYIDTTDSHIKIHQQIFTLLEKNK